MSVVFDSETRLMVSLRITVLFRFLNLAQVGSQTCVMILGAVRVSDYRGIKGSDYERIIDLFNRGRIPQNP
jgi:hypothetical protein